MTSELNNAKNPRRTFILWSIFYLVIGVALLAALYIATTRIRTRQLPVGSIELKVPYSKYLVGEPITFTLKNNFNSVIQVMNNCPSEPLEVYKYENESWVRKHDYIPESECDEDSRRIDVPAKGIVNGTYAPWKALFKTPGKYRIVAYVEYYNYLPYQDIEIIEAPVIGPAPSSDQSPAQQTVVEEAEQEETQAPAITPPASTYTQKQNKTVSIESGTVIVQYDSQNVYVVSIAPAPGCTYEGGNSGKEVEIQFKCGEQETQLQLMVINNQLVSEVEN